MIKSVLLIGLGGTGSLLAEPLARLLKPYNCNLILCDGDNYQPSNQGRQLFSHQFNKAICTKMELEKRGLQVEVIPEYLVSSNVERHLSYLGEDCCVITAVDRDSTRKLTLETLRELKDNFLWISPGNDYSYGCVQSALCRGGEEKGVDPLEVYDNLRNPQDSHPDEDCLELSESSPQLITANMGAAWITLSIIQNLLLLDNNKVPKEVWYDTERLLLKTF